MLPVLLSLGFLKIYTFGIFLVLAFFWGTFLLWKNIRLTSHREEEVFDGVFLSIFGALFMGRFIYVLLNFDKFGFDFIKFILINGYPGFSLYGLLFGGILTLYLFSIIKKIKFLQTIDYFISPLILTLAFGKLGAFFAGSEVGEKTKFVLSIKYFGIDSMRHLTPFYESLIFFVGAYISYKLLFEIRRQKYPYGFSFYFFLWLVSFVYFSFDKIKGNKLYLLNQSFNGFVSFIILLTFTIYFIYYFKNRILKNLILIKNSFTSYVKQIFARVHKKTRKKTSE